jgi:hypothetical protein
MKRKIGNSTLQAISTAVEEQVQNTPRVDLPITSLVPYVDSDGTTNDYIFGNVTEESVQNLASGIKKDGFQGAIHVWDLKNGTFMIFSGHRRAKAMQIIGAEKIPCLRFTLPDNELTRRRMFLGSNIYSRGSANASVEGGDIYIARQMKYLETILRKEGTTSISSLRQMIADEFLTSATKVWRYSTLLTASDDVVKAEADGIISLAQAASLSTYTEEIQKLIISAATSAANRGQELSKTDFEKIMKMIKTSEQDSSGINIDDFVRVSNIINQFLDSRLLDDNSVIQPTDEKTVTHKPAYGQKVINRISTTFSRLQLDKLSDDDKAQLKSLLTDALSMLG